MATDGNMPRAVTLWFIPWIVYTLLSSVEDFASLAGIALICLLPCYCVVVFPKFGFCKKYKDVKAGNKASEVTKVEKDPEANIEETA
jgi:hypothetical protein